MGRPKRALISRTATLKVALRIIDEEGLDELSIRRLGREFNVQGISLYHHFKNKDDILAGVCELALSNVRTPSSSDGDWREWLVQNAMAYRQALQAHPNLIPVLMRRHPLRIGLAEHNATAGLLSVQGVPAGAIMPLVEALEELALGSASYQSAVDNDAQSDLWKEKYPYLYHLSRKVIVSKDGIFNVMARAAVDAIVTAAEEAEAAAAAKVLFKTRAAASAARSRRVQPQTLAGNSRSYSDSLGP